MSHFLAAANKSVSRFFRLQWLLVAAETKKHPFTFKFQCTWWKQQFKTFSETNTCSGHHKPNYLNVTVYSMLRMETTKASLCRRNHRCTAFYASFSVAIENGSNQCKSKIIWVCLAYLFTGTMHGLCTQGCNVHMCHIFQALAGTLCRVALFSDGNWGSPVVPVSEQRSHEILWNAKEKIIESF